MKNDHFLDKHGLNYKVDRGIMETLALLTQIGLLMISSIILWTLLALFIKRTFLNYSIILPIGILLGISSGFYADYHLLSKYFKKREKMNEQ